MRKTVKQRREQRRQNARELVENRYCYAARRDMDRIMRNMTGEYLSSGHWMPTPFLDALRKSPAPVMAIDRVSGLLVPVGRSPMAEAMEAQCMVNEIVRLTHMQIRLSAPSEEEMQRTGTAIVIEDLRRHLDEEMMKLAGGPWPGPEPAVNSKTLC